MKRTGVIIGVIVVIAILRKRNSLAVIIRFRLLRSGDTVCIRTHVDELQAANLIFSFLCTGSRKQDGEQQYYE